MKKVKSMIAAAIFMAALVTVPATAQNRPGGRGGEREELTTEQRVERQMQQLTEQLGLDAEQVEKITVLMTEQQANQGERQGGQEDGQQQKMTAKERKAMREEATKKQEEYKAAMKEILTPEQYTKYEELQSQRGQRGQGGERGERPQRDGGFGDEGGFGGGDEW